MIDVIRAYRAGFPIQARLRLDGQKEPWRPCSKPVWNFAEFEYRVKPCDPAEPVEVFLNVGAGNPLRAYLTKDEAISARLEPGRTIKLRETI